MISAKKLLLVAQKIAIPFTRSGSFETGFEGWSVVDMQRGSSSRTGSFALTTFGTGNILRSMTYRLNKDEAAGLRVRLRMHMRSRSNSENREEFLIDGQLVQSTVLTRSSTFIANQAEFVCPRGKGIDVRLTFIGPGQDNDDWSIEGVRP